MPKHSNLVRPLAALAAALLLAACSAETAPAPRAERPVQVQSVAYQAEDAARDFVGVVRARYETDLGFRVGGKMVARLVNVGDRVRTGDVVARLDPEDLRLQVESAEAELAAATTNLTQISASKRAVLRRSPISTARPRRRAKQKVDWRAPSALSILRATSSIMPSSRRERTAS